MIEPSLLEEAVERLKAAFQPEAIYLFGSHAWGTPDADSDVDLMVIVPDSNERGIQRMQRAHRCLGGIGFAKDVLVPTRTQVDRYKHLRTRSSPKGVNSMDEPTAELVRDWLRRANHDLKYFVLGVLPPEARP